MITLLFLLLLLTLAETFRRVWKVTHKGKTS